MRGDVARSPMRRATRAACASVIGVAVKIESRQQLAARVRGSCAHHLAAAKASRGATRSAIKKSHCVTKFVNRRDATTRFR
jgi:hypothetical protein